MHAAIGANEAHEAGFWKIAPYSRYFLGTRRAWRLPSPRTRGAGWLEACFLQSLSISGEDETLGIPKVHKAGLLEAFFFFSQSLSFPWRWSVFHPLLPKADETGLLEACFLPSLSLPSDEEALGVLCCLLYHNIRFYIHSIDSFKLDLNIFGFSRSIVGFKGLLGC